jgi:hypothetical protein
MSPIAYDWQVCQMVKTLTSTVERWGHGLWLTQPEVSFTRVELYHAAGLGFVWDYEQDEEAVRRLSIWYWEIARRGEGENGK